MRYTQSIVEQRNRHSRLSVSTEWIHQQPHSCIRQNVPVNNDEWELMSQTMRPGGHLLLGTSEANAARHS